MKLTTNIKNVLKLLLTIILILSIPFLDFKVFATTKYVLITVEAPTTVSLEEARVTANEIGVDDKSQVYTTKIAPSTMNNSIQIEVPQGYTGNIEVLGHSDSPVVSEWRTWELIFDSDQTLDWNNADFFEPKQTTENKVPILEAADEHIFILAGKNTEAIKLVFNKTDGSSFEQLADQWPFMIWTKKETKRAYFYFDGHTVMPSDIDNYVLHVKHANDTITSYTYDVTGETNGTFIKQPSVNNIETDYALSIDGGIPPDTPTGGSLYYVNWYKISSDTQLPKYPSPLNDNSISLILYNSGYKAYFNNRLSFTGDNKFVYIPPVTPTEITKKETKHETPETAPIETNNCDSQNSTTQLYSNNIMIDKNGSSPKIMGKDLNSHSETKSKYDNF